MWKNIDHVCDIMAQFLLSKRKCCAFKQTSLGVNEVDNQYTSINQFNGTQYVSINHHDDTEFASINHHDDTQYTIINHHGDTQYASINHHDKST